VFWRGPRLMVGFRCHGCGSLDGVHESVTTRQTPNVQGKRAEGASPRSA
jgi:hypothetical protein